MSHRLPSSSRSTGHAGTRPASAHRRAGRSGRGGGGALPVARVTWPRAGPAAAKGTRAGSPPDRQPRRRRVHFDFPALPRPLAARVRLRPPQEGCPYSPRWGSKKTRRRLPAPAWAAGIRGQLCHHPPDCAWLSRGAARPAGSCSFLVLSAAGTGLEKHRAPSGTLHLRRPRSLRHLTCG